MKIAIIGAGFTGLSAAWYLRQAGHQVSVFEAQSYAGGLAAGFRQRKWNWTLEHHYHHIFTSDLDILTLARQMGLGDYVLFNRVRTSTYYQGILFQLDSALSLLRCPVLSIIARLRVAATLAFLVISPFWRPLEKVTAQSFLITTMGKEAWKVLWQPLFVGKFGKYASVLNAAWFWARIHVRSAQLGYFKGGFAAFAEAVVKVLKDSEVRFLFGVEVQQIAYRANKWQIIHNKKKEQFDQVLVTLPAHLLSRLVPQLPAKFVAPLKNLEGLGAVTLVLELKQPFFVDGTYWLNINQANWPFLAVVEHTHFVKKEHYNNHSIVYVGKYCPSDDTLFSLDADQILQKYLPYLEKLSPGFEQHIVSQWVFKAPFAQPIVRTNHSQHVPTTNTPFPGLYWACMQHIYPFDRGTNYAVKLGQQVAAQMNVQSIDPKAQT